ncbi:DUF2147 domain-containing protein [Qingshengfaniella alkalisoli]|uniref:DUF2147 domain-containing protein n=1 Tax=Qingshengfaniella alkalisoli TaxID=2599296 RepID=A0A5B8I5N9_9RHOB|nr:DUF2147 domain-containing protein [Qingshengfaniella alkalisoli]QDY68689.1 DUF2147 domain-containing protein [Qingshengfaniella alkalisoli]
MRNAIYMAATLTLIAGAAAADDVEGIWQTQPDDNGRFAHIEVAPCGAKLCGTIRTAFDGQGQPIASETIGKPIIWDMVPKGDGIYGDGKVYAPDRDKTYNSKMELAGDRLEVSGCVIAICRSQTWVRVR